MLYFFNFAYKVGLLMFSDFATIERLPPNLAIAARMAFSSVSSKVSVPDISLSAEDALRGCVISMSEAVSLSPSGRMTAF